MPPTPLRVKCCPVQPPSALSNLSSEESLLLAVSKQYLGICQLGLDLEEEGALPQTCALLGPCCLPTPQEGADWDPGQKPAGSGYVPSLLVLPQAESLEPPASTSPAGPGPGPGSGGASRWGWEGGGRALGVRDHSRKSCRELGGAVPCCVDTRHLSICVLQQTSDSYSSSTHLPIRTPSRLIFSDPPHGLRFQGSP